MKKGSIILVLVLLLLAAGTWLLEPVLAQKAGGSFYGGFIWGGLNLLLAIGRVLLFGLAAVALVYEHQGLRPLKTGIQSLLRRRDVFYRKFGKWAFVLMALLAAFAWVDQQSVRYISNLTSYDVKFPEGVTRQPAPYVMFKGQPNGEMSPGNRLNALGYPGPAPAAQKAEGAFRIFFFGGSTVFEGEPTLPELVEGLLRQKGHSKVEVYNFGVVSSGSKMDLARLVFEASKFQPDLVVFYNGANDMTHPQQYDPRPNYPFNFIAYERNVLLKKKQDYPLFHLALYKSNLLRVMLRQRFTEKFFDLSGTRQAAGHGTEAWKNSIAEDYVTTLGQAAKVSEAFGANFIAFFQPMSFFKDNLTEAEKGMADAALAEHHLDLRRRILALPKSGFSFVDISDVLDAQSGTMFTDFVHVTPEANALIGAELMKNIEMMLDGVD